MDLKSLNAILAGVPFTADHRAEQLYRFVLEHRFKSCLELGVAHGKGTAYIAGALQEIGEGKVVGVDNEGCRKRRPPPADVIAEFELDDYVELVYEKTSYTWYLMKLIRDRTADGRCQPAFDFCFIDGAHNWFVDGFAFFLVDKLLEVGGWILFDDVYWTNATSPSLKDTEKVANMPDEEKNAAQVKLVLDLLVAQHPNYDAVREDGNWAFVRKVRECAASSSNRARKGSQ